MRTRKKRLTSVIKTKEPVIEGELMPDGVISGVPAINISGIKEVVLDLTSTDKYINKLMRMSEKSPEKVMEIIIKQTDMLLMLTKEGALRYLSHGLEFDDQDALATYRQLIEASAIVMNDKANLAKILGLNADTGAPVRESYKTPQMTIEEWEKSFQPGLPAPKVKETEEKVYAGPKPSSVN